MKKKIGILIGLFIILVVAFAPARLAEGFIPKNNDLLVGNLTGSIWSGKVDQVLVKGWNLQEIEYDLSLLSLITGSFGGNSSVHKGDLKGDFSFQIGDSKNIVLSQSNIEIDAIKFEKYMPFPGINLDGIASTKDFSIQLIDQKPSHLSGMTSWNNANISLNGNNWPLGNFDLLWDTNQESKLITGTLSKTRKNQLGIEGKVTLTKEGLFEFRGSVSVSIDQNIYAALSLFSNGPVKDGRLPIKFKKKLY